MSQLILYVVLDRTYPRTVFDWVGKQNKQVVNISLPIKKGQPWNHVLEKLLTDGWELMMVTGNVPIELWNEGRHKGRVTWIYKSNTPVQ